MSTTKIFLELSSDVQGALADNGLSVEDVLEQNSIEATVTQGVLPAQLEEGARTKDVVTIILASSTAIAAIGFAISQVLNTIHNKPHVVEYYENIELRDADGQILKDKKNNPIFKVVKRQEILEPQKHERKMNFEASFDLTNGIVMKFGSQDK